MQDNKKVTILAVVVGLLVILFLVLLMGRGEVVEPEPQVESVNIEAEFEGKLVYTMDATEDEAPYRAHCEQEVGGVFNPEGNICEPGAETCAAVIAYTCEWDPNAEEEDEMEEDVEEEEEEDEEEAAAGAEGSVEVEI